MAGGAPRRVQARWPVSARAGLGAWGGGGAQRRGDGDGPRARRRRCRRGGARAQAGPPPRHDGQWSLPTCMYSTLVGAAGALLATSSVVEVLSGPEGWCEVVGGLPAGLLQARPNCRCARASVLAMVPRHPPTTREPTTQGASTVQPPLRTIWCKAMGGVLSGARQRSRPPRDYRPDQSCEAPGGWLVTSGRKVSSVQ